MISSEIKKLLKDKGITVEDLANAIGVSRSGLQLLFKNDDFKVTLLQKIADYLEVHIGYFFGNDESVYKRLIKVQEEKDSLEFLNRDTIDISELEKLCKELDKKVTNGEGLIYLAYDMIRQKFITQYAKIEKSK